MIKPTIYNVLRDKLGREPTNAELKAEVDRIKREALVGLAEKGKLPFQRGRRQPTKKTPPAQLQREIDEALARPRESTSAFQQARVEEAKVEREMSEAEQALKFITADVAQRLGVPERGPTGLTPDAVKETPEWRAAKASVDKAFARLRAFNAVFVKKFAKELRAERSERTRERESRSGSR